MSPAMETPQKYVLGLDVGSASLGWALIGLSNAGDPTNLIRAGVRIFEPGVDGTALDIQQGKDQSKAVDRRTARLHRRQLRRRAARQRELFQEMQKAGLLPEIDGGGCASSEQRHALLNHLDKQLALKFLTSGDDSFAQKPLYLLRKRALDHALEPFELGRVLFHLSQRRGFKSNRKETKKAAKDNEDVGQVNADINSLELAIKEADARTLGEYFAGLDPHTEKVRRRWTARKMFEHEFAEIWKKQSEFHGPMLPQELHDRVAYLLFFQHPIAKQAHLIGKCELEPGKRRAPWASLAAQRFRIWQKVNDLILVQPGRLADTSLSEEQRIKLFALLDEREKMDFTAIRKQLGIPEELKFNLERTEKSIRGNFTQHHMLSVFGGRWHTFSSQEQDKVVAQWSNSETDEELVNYAIGELGLDTDAIKRLTCKSAPSAYCSLSLRAIGKLMPLMQAGKRFKTAEDELYGNRFSGLEAHALLPPVRAKCGHRKADGTLCTEQHINSLRNPAVERSLTEMRKVVNAIVREYSKPYEIRIELARELKKPRSQRLEDTKDNGKRRKEREAIAERILKECGRSNPSRDDIEKARLHDECGGFCPYTGKHIPFSNLFDNSEFDVEHIIPRSRYPDNSFQNKTLCYLPENREYKRNLTPWEAYGKDPQRWAEITGRIASWKNNGKLKRFCIQSESELTEFSARQMNDTRYTSVLAGRLLESLYGGRDVVDGTSKRQVIYASSGAVTATLRRSWGFEQILQALVPHESGETRGKPRTDHRHHAIDAIVIALTRQSVIQAMAHASSLEPWQQGTRSWRRVPEPWTAPGFFRSVQQQIAEMVVSHRPEHKISGELHKGSNYARPYLFQGKSTVHTRCLISKLSAKDINADENENIIVDQGIRRALQAKLKVIGGDPKLFDRPENTPCLNSRDGRMIPIKKVRVRETKSPLKVGQGARERFVASAGIHHVALFVTRDIKRKEAWDSAVVQITEAYERQRLKKPLVSREIASNPDATFLFSLAKGDTVEITKNGESQIQRIREFKENKQIFMVPVNDAHPAKEQDALHISWSKKPSTIMPFAPRKVVVDLLGGVHPAND